MSGYSEVKEEALDRTLWRTRFERGNGLVLRETTIKLVKPRSKPRSTLRV